MEARQLLTTIFVNTTGDGDGANGSATLSLRQAIEISNGTLAVGSLTAAQQAQVRVSATAANHIEFAIPASTAALLNVPVAGFDPNSQSWTIDVGSPLPALSHQVIIDGGTEAVAGVPYRYPAQVTPTVLDPILITSVPSNLAAIDGNNATPRVIVEGGGMTSPGLVLDSPDSIIRGLNIDGFGVGVQVDPTAIGALVQGNSIGQYRLFFVDPTTGGSITGAGSVGLAGVGNSLQGVRLASTNATVGGVETQDANVIIGNGQQGVSILPGSQGNQVVGNQIGVAGPTATGGVYFSVPNGSDGVLVADSSNYIGGSVTGAGNLISSNLGDGVHIIGSSSIRNNVLGNYIGTSAGGGFTIGSHDPGNLGDGVAIDGAADNNIGGSAAAARNVISSNGGVGVRVFGASAVRNLLLNNYIGLTADGLSALGNAQEGVAITSASNTVGAGNVISSNLRGILLSGVEATGTLIQGSLIGTSGDGTADLGNALEGIRVDNAPDNTITGNAQGSQVISGNNVGLLLIGTGSTGNVVIGNFIGTDVTGMHDLGNAQEGVRIENAPGNVIGGTAATSRNLISANHTGVLITGATANGNVVQNNFIGTDITGAVSLGTELDGVFINMGASNNVIGGPTASAGNTIAFNRRDGVRIEDASVGNAILSNAIFANLGSGIDLVPPGPNGLPAAPALTSVATAISSTIIKGTLTSTPNTLFTIQFFASSTLDPTGQNEGGQYLGQVTAMTGPNGVATYTANVPVSLKAGQAVTATATNPAGDTSAFSNPLSEVFATVQFQMSSYVVKEGVGVATIVATRSGGSGGLFTVHYATADNTALAGVDYQAASGTLTFNPGVNSQTFTVTIIDNGLAKGDVMALLNLSNPTGPATLGPLSTATLTILGNQPGTLQFSMAGYTVEEAAGVATITVTREQDSATATVDYTTGLGSALLGIDYVPTSGTLTFNPGEFAKTFTIPILINPSIPGNVSVGLFLSNPTDAAMLAPPSSAILTIQPGVLQFSMSSYSVGEAGGSATLTVTRTGSIGTATVQYSTFDGSAHAGVDYVPTSGTLTFLPGQQALTITVPILINPLILGNEVLGLALTSPAGGAILGTPSTASLTIVDDGVDRMGPHVTSVQAISGAHGVARIVVGFDEPLNAALATNLLNYGYSVRTPGKDGKLGTADDKLVGLDAATYDPTDHTVTLSLATSVPKGMKLLLMINQATNVLGAGVGVSDVLGNLLDGDHNGHPGGSFSTAVVAQPLPPVVVSKTVSHKAKPAKHPVTITPSHPKAKAAAKPKHK